MRINEAGKYACPGSISKNKTGVWGTFGWFRLAVALLLLLPTLSAFGQFESASVLGYAKDSSGAAIAATAVTLTNIATSISQMTKTDSEGRYEFPSVPIGEYKVTAESAGFERVQTQNFTVTTNARQRVDVTMKLGSVTETDGDGDFRAYGA
jgi:hypothetical protein